MEKGVKEKEWGIQKIQEMKKIPEILEIRQGFFFVQYNKMRLNTICMHL